MTRRSDPLQRVSPIPDDIEDITRSIGEQFLSGHPLRPKIELVNTINPHIEIALGSTPTISIDWSLIEIILVCYKILVRAPDGNEYFYIDRIAHQMWKVLAWKHGMAGEPLYAEFFRWRFEAASADFYKEVSYAEFIRIEPSDKPIVRFLIGFLISHELAHLDLIHTDEPFNLAFSNLARLSERLEWARVPSDQSFIDIRGKDWAATMVALQQADPSYAEEIFCDTVAFEATIRLQREISDSHLAGVCLGTLFGASQGIDFIPTVGAADQSRADLSRGFLRSDVWKVRGNVAPFAMMLAEGSYSRSLADLTHATAFSVSARHTMARFEDTYAAIMTAAYFFQDYDEVVEIRRHQSPEKLKDYRVALFSI